jgi:protein gp37
LNLNIVFVFWYFGRCSSDSGFHDIRESRISPPLIGFLAKIDLREIHWVIVGGESGPHARPMNVRRVRGIFRACRPEKVWFFFRQWNGVRKHMTGQSLGGRTYDQLPQAE